MRLAALRLVLAYTVGFLLCAGMWWCIAPDATFAFSYADVSGTIGRASLAHTIVLAAAVGFYLGTRRRTWPEFLGAITGSALAGSAALRGGTALGLAACMAFVAIAGGVCAADEDDAEGWPVGLTIALAIGCSTGIWWRVYDSVPNTLLALLGTVALALYSTAWASGRLLAPSAKIRREAWALAALALYLWAFPMALVQSILETPR